MKDYTCWYPEYYRSTDDQSFVLLHFLRDFIFQHRLRYMIYFRIAQQTKNKALKLVCEYKLFKLCRKYGIEIKTSTSIGKGFLLIHPYNITVHLLARLGENVTMLKGSTIGMSWGKNKGAPEIGNCVYIGLNSTIIGGITIGDDVVIAPNTFVNQDIPSHSIVLGNPCQIIHKPNATKNFIWKKI